MRLALSGTGGIVLFLCSQPLLFAQRASVGARRSSVSIPFVGCKSEGQADPIDAPTGTSVSVPANPETARRVAFYKASLSPGVLAPRGWYCLGIYGADGQALLVSPEPIDITKISSGQPRLVGPVIEISYIFGDTSGRFEVAEIIARIFPAYKAFVGRVNEGFDLTFPSGPYPTDRLNYKGRTVVEYETPAKTDGLGTYRFLEKNSGPIDGVAVLVGQTPDLVLLKVRIPGDLAKLTPEIVRHVERAYAK